MFHAVLFFTTVLSDCTYRAASLQYTSKSLNPNDWDAQDYLRLNLDGILGYVEQAASQGVDVIVFPEASTWSPGLWGNSADVSFKEGRDYMAGFAELLPAVG